MLKGMLLKALMLQSMGMGPMYYHRPRLWNIAGRPQWYPDNRHPDNCNLGQSPPRTTATRTTATPEVLWGGNTFP